MYKANKWWSTFSCLSLFFPCDQHGIITTEEEQYLIEPLKNTSSPAGERNPDEAQQHVIYKMSAMPSSQEQSQESSCGISGGST